MECQDNVSWPLQQVDDSNKTFVIDRRLTRRNIDIATQETRIPLSGSPREQDYTFFWQGREPEEPSRYDIGAGRRIHFPVVQPASPSTKCQPPRDQWTSWAFTLPHSALLWRPRRSSTGSLTPPSEEILYRIGEFNVRLGSDHDSRPSCISHFGIDK